MIKSSDLLIFFEKINLSSRFSIRYLINSSHHFNLFSLYLFIFWYEIFSHSNQKFKSQNFQYFKIKEDKLIINVSIMITLTSLNYHIWINELKTIAEKARVWKFIDSNIHVEKSQSSKSFVSSDYQMNNRSAISLKKLIAEQREEYKADMLEYNMLKKLYEETIRELQTIDNAICTSAKQYISSNQLRSLTHKIIQLLATRYKLD